MDARGLLLGFVARLEGDPPMSEPEVTSTRDDPELRAMLAITRYFAPLNRSACQRILAWAEKRYTTLDIADADLEAFTHFTESLLKAAQEIGDVTPRDIIRLVDAVQADRETERS